MLYPVLTTTTVLQGCTYYSGCPSGKSEKNLAMLGIAYFYGAHFYISMSDHAKLESQLESCKLSNIYVFSFEVIGKWTVVPLQGNGKDNCCCKATGQVAKFSK